MSVAAAEFVTVGSTKAQSGKTTWADVPAIKTGTNTSFGSLKQIEAGVLSVGFAEAGPADGPAVILLHGWPYDIHTFVDVAPMLASKGYRVIVPYLRGYGTTRFLSNETVRNAPAIGRCRRCYRFDGFAQNQDVPLSVAVIGARGQRALSQHSGLNVVRVSSP